MVYRTSKSAADKEPLEKEKLIKRTALRTSRGRTATGAPNPVDVFVGERIRLRRTLLGLSQEKLAVLLGLTFQQVQKYERGVNRIGASRLWDIGKVLEVPVEFFYMDMDKETSEQSPRMFSIQDACPQNLQEEHNIQEVDPMLRRETLELVKAYYKIPNRKAAEELLKLIITMSHPNFDKEVHEDSKRNTSLGADRKKGEASAYIITDDDIIFTNYDTAQAIAETWRDDDFDNPEFKCEDLY